MQSDISQFFYAKLFCNLRESIDETLFRQIFFKIIFALCLKTVSNTAVGQIDRLIGIRFFRPFLVRSSRNFHTLLTHPNFGQSAHVSLPAGVT